MLESKTRFRYTVEYQWDLLRYIVQDKNGERALKKIQDEYFTLIEHQVIAYTLLQQYKRERKIPGETILREAVLKILNSKEYINLITKSDQTEVLALIKPLYREVVRDGEKIYSMLKDFVSYVKMRDLVENIDINDFERYEQFSQQVQVAVSDEDEKENIASSFLLNNIKERQLKRQQNSNVFPTPFKQVNDITNAGGYEAGSIIVILDKQKKGKTATLVNVARGYLRMKKKVLVIDLENGQDSWFSRIEQSIMNISKVDLLSGEYDEDVQKRFRKYKRLGGEIAVLRLPAMTTTANDIENEMNKLYRENGFDPEYLIIDYAAKMGSISNRDDDRNRISDVYLELGNLALKKDIKHIWTANHVTRDGARNRMKTRYVGEDIALCIDIVRHAHAIFGLNRTEPEEESGYFRMELVEQRDGKPNGRAVFRMNMETQRADELKYAERKEYDEIFQSYLEEDNDIKVKTKPNRKDDFS